MFNDPSGEFAWIPLLIAIGKAALIGAGVGAGIYLVQAAITDNFSWKAFGKSVLMGAITGAVSGGISHIFSVSSFWGTVGVGALTGGVNGGITALINGENFLKSVVKGAVIGGAIAGVSWGIREFFTSKTVEYHDMPYSENDVISSGGEEGSLNNTDLKETWRKNWKPAYESTENAKPLCI